jgi:hypothetical protein
VPRRAARVAAVVVAGAVGTALAGCGGDRPLGPNARRFEGERRAVATVVDDLVVAAHDGDARRVCRELFTSALALAVAERAGTSCEAAVRRNLVIGREEIRVMRVGVKPPQAHATVREVGNRVSRLGFLRHDGAWRISAIR